MEIMLSTMKWQKLVLYLGDITIFSRSVQKHFEHKLSVLELLFDAW